MKGFLERKQLVIEVMTDLVYQGAQESLERDHLLLLSGSHPQRDARSHTLFFGLVESMQLPVVVGRPPQQHFHPDRGHVITLDERIDQILARGLRAGAVLVAQPFGNRGDGARERKPRRNAQRCDGVALAVDALAGRRKLVVVGERHANRSKIASKSIQLRGAGNMLGRQQHGHIEAIGFDMYCQMLERAVSKLKGEEVAPDLRTTLSLGFDVRIPQDYIPSENLRLRTYKRISSIASEEDKQDVRKELEDRFGAPPSSVENLLEYAALKSMCERLRISAVERQGTRIAVRFHPETTLDPAKLVSVVRSRTGIKLDPSGVLWMEVKRGESIPAALRNVLLGLQGQG